MIFYISSPSYRCSQNVSIDLNPRRKANLDASKFLNKPPATAPLFQGSAEAFDSDTEAFLGWVDNSIASTSSSDDNENNPPDEIAIERAPEPDWANFSTTQPIRQQQPQPGSPTPQVCARIEQLFAMIYIVLVAMTLAIGTLVSFSTNPSLGGVYPVFGKSSGTLLVLGVFSILVAVAWLWCMRTHSREMVQLNTFAIPVVCCFTSLYAFIGSVHQAKNHFFVHTIMRVGALVPLLAAAGWFYVLRRDKQLVGRASDMITLALKTVDKSPAIMAIGTCCGLCATIFTYLWILFLSRAFLEGSLSLLFATLFSFVYIWTWSILCNIQKCLITLTTTHWVNNYDSEHATVAKGTSWTQFIELAHRFGGCCFSSFLSIWVKGIWARAPGLVFGKWPSRFTQFWVYLLTPRTIVAILDPLTLPVAVVDRSSVVSAANRVVELFDTVDRRTYWLAKMFLSATKLTFSLVVGFIGWIHADRADTAANIYSYLIAIAAFLIGWTVIGSAENTLSMILDALFVNYVLDPRRNRELHRVFSLDVTAV